MFISPKLTASHPTPLELSSLLRKNQPRFVFFLLGSLVVPLVSLSEPRIRFTTCGDSAAVRNPIVSSPNIGDDPDGGSDAMDCDAGRLFLGFGEAVPGKEAGTDVNGLPAYMLSALDKLLS